MIDRSYLDSLEIIDWNFDEASDYLFSQLYPDLDPSGDSLNYLVDEAFENDS